MQAITEQTDYLQKATPICSGIAELPRIQQMMSQPGNHRASPAQQALHPAERGLRSCRWTTGQRPGCRRASRTHEPAHPEEQRPGRAGQPPVQETAIAPATAVRQTGPGRDARSGQQVEDALLNHQKSSATCSGRRSNARAPSTRQIAEMRDWHTKRCVLPIRATRSHASGERRP